MKRLWSFLGIYSQIFVLCWILFSLIKIFTSAEDVGVFEIIYVIVAFLIMIPFVLWFLVDYIIQFVRETKKILREVEESKDKLEGK